MKNIIIITGHGQYAKGIISAVDLISGLDDDIYSIDYNGEEKIEIFEEKFKEIIDHNKDCGILIICDLLGGTPYKVAAKLSMFNNNIKVISGANLGGIVSAKMKKDMFNIADLANHIISATNKNILLFNNIKKDER